MTSASIPGTIGAADGPQILWTLIPKLEKITTEYSEYMEKNLLLFLPCLSCLPWLGILLPRRSRLLFLIEIEQRAAGGFADDGFFVVQGFAECGLGALGQGAEPTQGVGGRSANGVIRIA
jgi:hypothetical protein